MNKRNDNQFYYAGLITMIKNLLTIGIKERVNLFQTTYFLFLFHPLS